MDDQPKPSFPSYGNSDHELFRLQNHHLESRSEELRVSMKKQKDDETSEEFVGRERIRGDLENEEESEKFRLLSENLAEIESVQECLVRETGKIDGGKNNSGILEGIELDEANCDQTGCFSKKRTESEPVKESLVTVTEKIGEENKLEILEFREDIEIEDNREIGDFSEQAEAVIAATKLNEYKSDKVGNISEKRAEIVSVKKCLVKVIETIGGENDGETRNENEAELFEKLGDFSMGIEEVSKLAVTVNSKLNEYKETREKDKIDKIRIYLENIAEIESIKECLNRVIENISGENNGEMREGIETELVDEIGDFSMDIKEILKLVCTVESKVREYKDEREKEKSDKVKALSNHLKKITSFKESMVRLLESIDQLHKTESTLIQNEETKQEIKTNLGQEYMVFWEEMNVVSNLVIRTELKIRKYEEMKEKEKRELENSVVSLTEENRDINTLLRVALAEKEAVERSLNRLKGNNEPKRGALWGLPRVGFGFMMGTTEQVSDNSSVKSDSSECEEEVESLTSTIERMMKNLRLEITKLRKSLEESRSDTERLQSLAEKQALIISENAFYIREMEDREAMLAHNVEELLMEIKETEEEVGRWREACEFEVQAGKSVVEERDKMVFILKQELEKTKSALERANGKLKLKEDLANAAMAAQAAGEKSLQLTDSRVSVLNERVEELTKQLEKAENKDNIRTKVTSAGPFEPSRYLIKTVEFEIIKGCCQRCKPCNSFVVL